MCNHNTNTLLENRATLSSLWDYVCPPIYKMMMVILAAVQVPKVMSASHNVRMRAHLRLLLKKPITTVL